MESRKSTVNEAELSKQAFGKKIILSSIVSTDNANNRNVINNTGKLALS
jgi:hypothetical protein